MCRFTPDEALSFLACCAPGERRAPALAVAKVAAFWLAAGGALLGLYLWVVTGDGLWPKVAVMCAAAAALLWVDAALAAALVVRLARLARLARAAQRRRTLVAFLVVRAAPDGAAPAALERGGAALEE
jgi:hypothetical protein